MRLHPRDFFERQRPLTPKQPDFVAKRVEALTPDALEQHGLGNIKTICFDVDGTLGDYHATELPETVRYMLEALQQSGRRVAIVSNAYGERVDELHTMFASMDIQVITPETMRTRRTKAKDHKKPYPDMILHAVGSDNPEDVLMVGDQWLKDGIAASAAGVKSMIVERRGEKDDWRVKYLQRGTVEKFAVGGLLRRTRRGEITPVTPEIIDETTTARNKKLARAALVATSAGLTYALFKRFKTKH